MRFDSSSDIGGVARSESVTDLNLDQLNNTNARESRGRPSTASPFGKGSVDGDLISAPPKPFGLGEFYKYNIYIYS